MQRKQKILIVEDHKDMLNIITRYLAEQGFEAIGTETAEVGLQRFEEEKPDMVLMDIMLPGMSGLEAMSRLKEQFTADNYVPIILITAKNTISDIVLGLESGADDYIVKPFNFEELLARVRTALRLKELNETLVRQTKELAEANDKINQLNRSLMSKNKELRRNIFNLRNLFEVSLELNSILDLKRLINSVLLTLVGQFSCKNALFFYTQRQNKGRMEVLNSKGFYQDEIENLQLTKSDPLFDYLTEHTRPDRLETIYEQVRKSEALSRLLALKMDILSPIVIKKKVEGLICLGPRVKKGSHSERDLEHISILTNIIAIAVHNAYLYEQVEELSYTDGMTALHNYRYFELRLKEEILRHKRTQSGLSLLILDVDYFKNYNDQMGHPAGDRVLRKIAAVLKETVRENDIVARYGGEEFAVIMPGEDKKGAFVLADRIRDAVEKTYFEHEEVQPNGKITVSIGCAALPEDADDANDLIHKADTALYAAKKAGRNQVKIFTPEMVQ
ncbi:MAG TPA: diguanylate cyclase [Caldithrix abyssi]|uniref:diguanylate cyclase n=1 Tax=Caldithrix abyssi TaxID=187145 RepID=A0A7V4U0I9_CALAY|nr:diguanylate cyclase [Caldithrix abyssi]